MGKRYDNVENGQYLEDDFKVLPSFRFIKQYINGLFYNGILKRKHQKRSVLKNTESGYNNPTPCLDSQGIEYGRIMFCVHVDFLEFR